MARWQRLVWIASTILILIIISLTLVLPSIIASQAKSWVAEQTGRNLTIGDIRFNPLGLTVKVDNLVLTEPDQSTPFISWETLHVSLSTMSLFRLAPVIDKLHLEKPRVHLVRLEGQRFNFSDLILEASEADNSGSGTDQPFRFALANLTIHNGYIELVDRTLDEQLTHTIRDLNIALPSVGNLPYMVEDPVTPMFQAVINDSPVDISGEATPFSDDQEMRFNLELADIDLPEYLSYLPMDLPFKMLNGRLSVDLNLHYRYLSQTGPQLEISGNAALAALNMHDRLGEQLFFMPLLQVEIAPSQVLQKSVHLSSVQVYNLEVQLHRDQQGVWNHARLKMETGGESDTTEPVEENSSPFQLRVDEFQVRDGEIHFSDRQVAGGFATWVKAINIDLNDFTLDGMEPAPFRIDLQTDRDEDLTASGQLLINPLTLQVGLEAKRIAVGAYAPYYADAYAKPLGGFMDLGAEIEINPEQPLLVSNGRLQWHGAYLAFNQDEGLGVDLVDVDGLSFNLAENHLRVASARYLDGKVKFSRTPKGEWSFLSQNFPILKKLTEAPETQPKPQQASAGSEFSYRIDLLAAENWAFDIHDRVPATPARFQATDFNLEFSNLAAPDKVESPFEFSTKFQKRGQIDLKGQASLADQRLHLNGRVKRLPLAGFSPYLAEISNLALQSGHLDATVQAGLSADQGANQLTFAGDVGISRVAILDKIDRDDLVKWESLQFAGITAQSPQPALHIDSITLSDYFAKVLIDEEGRLNLADALRRNPSNDNQTDADASRVNQSNTETAPEEQQSDDRPEIKVETVVLQGGQVDYTDRNLFMVFHADMQELGGRISGLSSDPGTRAEVDLRGKLRNHSPMTISGLINPLAENLFLDLKMNFEGIDLSPMSPYSGTYVGYLIEKGKLNLGLEYYIEDHRLKAKNTVFLDQFTFGEPIESEKATSLPVKLAVALLKDRRGEIHLDIPVSGDLDDPQFSVVGVVWTILKNLLVKAATSPMAVLGAVFGGSGEDFSSIHFAYGSAKLPPPEREKLDKIAQALLDRPSLNLEISGYVDPDNDPEGYRRQLLEQKVRELRFQELADDDKLPEEATTAEDIEVPAEEYPEYVWEVYKNADFPKVRNFVGMTKKLPLEELEKLIYANTIVDDETLAKLAQARVEAAQSYLVEHGGLPKERVFLIHADILEPPADAKASRSRVEFGVTVK